MADKLVIDYRRDGFRIAWWLEGDDDFGLYVGESISDDVENGSEKQECIVAENAARKTKGVQFDNNNLCFYWETISNARAALREINAALNAFRANRVNLPWPDWAIKAKADGWKPPKNWKP